MNNFRWFLLALVASAASTSAGCSGEIGDTGADPRNCNPALTLSPSSATVAPLAQVTLSASGGRGAYAYEIATDLSGAHINTNDGSYLAGATTGVTDTVRVTAASCIGEATAEIFVPDVLDVQPSSAELPPSTSFTFVVTRGSGSFAFALTGNASGATLDAQSGLYAAGTTDGIDVVRVSDAVTGSFKDVTLTVSASATVVADPPHLGLPVGATTVLYARGGSGHVTANASGGVASFEDGVLKALSPGSVALTLTDVFTHQTAAMTLDVSAAYEAPTLRGGDKDTFRNIYMPPIVGRDIDGDGKSEILVGYADTSYDAALSGAVYLYKGTNDISGRFQPTLTLSGSEARERFGSALALGDFDGNSVLDLAVGSSNADVSFTDAGAVRIFPGVADDANLFSKTASLVIAGDAPQDTSGSALAACDFTGDHITDLAIGIPAGESSSTVSSVRNQGAIRIIAGSATGLDPTSSQYLYGQLPDADGNLAAVASLQLGGVLAAADIDGDGRCELVSSAAGYVPTGTTAAYGAIVVYKFDSDGVVEQAPAMIIRSIAASAATELGRRISLRDINGDGKLDILTGERSTTKGRALVFNVDLNNADVTTDGAAVALDGLANGELCGASVDAADMDGDTQLDLVVGCINVDSGTTADVGAVRIYTGHSGSMPTDPPARTITGTALQDRFGNVVASVGDVNGDGFADLVVHVRDGDTEGLNFGALNLVSSNTAAATIDMAIPGRSSLQQNGASVAMIGDLNGDGTDEIAVGVPLANVDLGVHNVDGLDAGRAIVYDGKQLTPLVLLEKHALHTSGDKLGTKVARMGDFDGDGHPDVAVLAASDSRPSTFPASFVAETSCPGATGAVYIYGGTAAGTIDSVPHFVIFGPQGDIVSVASDFDFNNDGKNDIIVGGVSWDASADIKTAGGARVYFGQAGAGSGKTQVLCTPAYDVRGFAASDRMGSDVASLGDIDGDSCDDVAVAADSYESTSALRNEGGVLVIFGTGTGCTAGPRYGMLHSGLASATAGRALAAADIDRHAVGGRSVNELMVSSVSLASSGVTLGGLWVVRGDVLAALSTATMPSYPVTAFVDERTETSVLVGPEGGEQFGTTIAALPATASQPGVVLVGVALSSDSGVARSGAVFGFHYVVGTTSDPGIDDNALLRLGGEATSDGSFGSALMARRLASGAVRIIVGASASDGLSGDGTRIDDGAAYLFSIDSLQ